jgi:hypothetical protein
MWESFTKYKIGPFKLCWIINMSLFVLKPIVLPQRWLIFVFTFLPQISHSWSNMPKGELCHQTGHLQHKVSYWKNIFTLQAFQSFVFYKSDNCFKSLQEFKSTNKTGFGFTSNQHRKGDTVVAPPFIISAQTGSRVGYPPCSKLAGYLPHMNVFKVPAADRAIYMCLNIILFDVVYVYKGVFR